MTQTERQQRFQNRMDEHRKILYKICRLYCFDPQAREDLAQEILTQLWRSYATFDERCQFSTWMYRVALNTAISFVRGESIQKRQFIVSEPSQANFIPAPDTESEEVRTMYGLIANLDPLQRALILLYLDGNSYEETAAILGISVTNVATKLNRIKIAMKQDAASGLQQGKGSLQNGT